MKIIGKWIYCLFTILWINKSNAQESIYTLPQCIDAAIKNNIDVKNAEYKMQSNEVGLKQIRANRFPSLSASINHGLAYGRSIDPTSNSYIDQQIITAQYNFSSGVTLWNGESVQNNIMQNKLNYEASKMDVEQVKNDLTINVILAYLQVLNNQDQLALAIQQTVTTKKQVIRLTFLNKNGAVAPSTFYDQKGQLGNDELNINSAKSTLETSKLALLQLMNMPYSSNMQLVSIDTNKQNEKYDVTVENIYKQAIQNLALVKAAELRNKSAAKNVAVAKGQLMPTLSMNGIIGTNFSNSASIANYVNTKDVATNYYVTTNNIKTFVYVPQQNYSIEKISYGSQWSNNLSSYIGLGLQIPIFNAGKLRNQVKLAKLNEQQTDEQSKTTNIRLRQSIEQAYISMNAAYDRLQILKEQVEDYYALFRISSAKYEAGAITSVDYIISKNNYDKANTNLIASKYDYILKTKILDYYQGKSLF